MINETISANESLSASADNKIASILPASVAMSDAKPASTSSNELTEAVKLALSVSLACNFVMISLSTISKESTEAFNAETSPLVATISLDKATSNESTEETKSPETEPNLVSIEDTSPSKESIDALMSITSPLVAAISVSNLPSILASSDVALVISLAKSVAKPESINSNELTEAISSFTSPFVVEISVSNLASILVSSD